MEKICIVKLRKRMANPVPIKEECGRVNYANEDGMLKESTLPLAGNRNRRAVHDGSDAADSKKDAARTVSLMLTPEQMKALRSDPCLVSFLNGEPAEKFETLKHLDKAIVIKFEFAAISPLRLLKVKEVVQMLRMSRGYLNKIIKQGKLNSYKFDRLRRIMLDDVLSYLEANREFPDTQQWDSKSKIFHDKRV